MSLGTVSLGPEAEGAVSLVWARAGVRGWAWSAGSRGRVPGGKCPLGPRCPTKWEKKVINSDKCMAFDLESEGLLLSEDDPNAQEKYSRS